MNGEQLAKAREKAGFTQKQLGDLLGVTDQTVSNWEAHRSYPKLTPRQTLQMVVNLPLTLPELADICDAIEAAFRANKAKKSA